MTGVLQAICVRTGVLPLVFLVGGGFVYRIVCRFDGRLATDWDTAGAVP